MKHTRALSKEDAFQDMENIVRTLKRAGDLYRSSRARNGIYDFLHAAYAVYWVLKRRGSIGRQKKLLRLAANVSSSDSRRLSDLILYVAAQKCDRRDRHRWKKLLEAAFHRRIHPRELVGELKAAHGVNGALKLWCAPPAQPSATLPSTPALVVHETDTASPSAASQA